MKTPDEIKEAAEICKKDCYCTECPYYREGDCVMNLLTDAIAYIEQLEAEREGKSDERNA